jgi:mono/diheme cytochrome c family protein
LLASPTSLPEIRTGRRFEWPRRSRGRRIAPVSWWPPALSIFRHPAPTALAHSTGGFAVADRHLLVQSAAREGILHGANQLADAPMAAAIAFRIRWRRRCLRCHLLVLAGACATATLSAAAQTMAPANPPLTIRSVVGGDSFRFYCATCHGRDGKGNGPVVAALKRPPPDLTRVALRNGGVFPRARVEAYLTDDGVPPAAAHGNTEMPVWGPIFRGLDPSDALVKVRIANLVGFIESIQVRE